MTPIQQILLGAGGADKKTYIDDLFSTFLYDGTASTQSINNGIDLSGEGGMVWVKSRGNDYGSRLVDTVRGVTKGIESYDTTAEATESNGLTAFNNNGFTVGTQSHYNGSGFDITSWSFRRASGFFDIVSWTGDGNTSKTISHSLGSVPGMILIKNRSSMIGWCVYHSRINGGVNPANYNLQLDTTSDKENYLNRFNNTEPTSTAFTVGSSNRVNTNGDNYVAYVFAGGESTAATAKSVDFDGNDYLVVADSSNNDFYFGTGNFTVEGWVYPEPGESYGEIIGAFHPTGSYYGWLISTTFGSTDGHLAWYNASSGGSNNITGNTKLNKGQWHHVAVTRSGNTFRMFLNGTEEKTWTQTAEVGDPDTSIHIGADTNPTPFRKMTGRLSNIRVVKGTAVYTSSFKPPTEPLTNITNTKLLCCNDSSTTGSTVTPGTISTVGDPTAKTDSPFDDPAGFVFGEGGDQNIIKTGSYAGNGSSTGPEINLGWEPQWVLTKNADISDVWYIYDNMRGIVSGGYDPRLTPNSSGAESAGDVRIDVTPTGFKIKNDNGDMNGNGNTIIYCAIRRPDGYVGKPADAGTDVLAMATGNSNADRGFTSGFPVDWAWYKKPASTHNWYPHARLTGKQYMILDLDNAEQTNSWGVWDDNAGWAENTYYDSDFQSWMWKRHAGFDVVTYTGNKVAGLQIPHSLNAVPEMMWVKNRGASENWAVYHKGLNGGTNPEQYFITLNGSDAEYGSASSMWNSTAPTSTHFTLGSWDEMNANNGDHIAMLFASVDGSSKVGYFTGNATELDHTITTGFQPRFVFIKRTNDDGSWMVHDTVRGFTGTGTDDPYLRFNSDAAQTDFAVGYVTSTGFVLTTTSTSYNASGSKYIYYAHA